MLKKQAIQAKKEISYMTSLLQNAFTFNPNVDINFDGGNLTSDAGLLLYREFDKRIGFSESIEAHLRIKDKRSYKVHSNPSMIVQKIFQILADNGADDCADSLKDEPLYKCILGKSSLASQPSLSRLHSRMDQDTLDSFEELHAKQLDTVYALERPNQIILDIDSTNFATYGKQEDSNFNYHYQTTGYHPLMVFDGCTGDLLKAQLRPGNVYTSRDVVEFLSPLLTNLKTKYSEMPLYVRADSGFATPDLYDLLEPEKVQYTIRLKANATLYKLAKGVDDKLTDLCKNDMCSYHVLYEEFTYQAASWSKPRRVVVKVEKPADQFLFNHMFLVTNMPIELEQVVRYYCNRGTMENFIKEGKNSFDFERMSSSSFKTNANKLQIAMLAYNLNNWFRRLCFEKEDQHLRMESIRSKLIKVAAKVVTHARRISINLCTYFPYKNIFLKILENLQAIRLQT